MFNFIRYWFNNPRYNPKQFDNMDYAKLLYKGKAYGFKFYVVDRNISPCAYIQIPPDHCIYAEDYDDLPEELHAKVHGGITWSDYGILYYRFGRRYYEKGDWFIGWDYGHLGDRLSFSSTGKKWKTREIVKECKEMCKVISNSTTMKLIVKDEKLKKEFENLVRELEEDLNGRLAKRTTKDKSGKANRKWR